MTSVSRAMKLNLPIGKMGTDVIVSGITICEENRATVWEKDLGGIAILCDMAQKNYINKGVNAVVFGTWNNSDVEYAIFVQDDWLIDVGEEL